MAGGWGIGVVMADVKFWNAIGMKKCKGGVVFAVTIPASIALYTFIVKPMD